MSWLRVVLACVVTLGVSAGPASAGAQGARPTIAARLAAADASFDRGAVARAESVYYRVALERPRDPTARIALARYLASRGAFRVAAVLLEEARTFGGDPDDIAFALLPVYGWLGDHRALAALPRAPLDPRERARAAWLGSRGAAGAIADSAVARYRPVAGTDLGRITLHVGGSAIDAVIVPEGSEIMVRGDQSAALMLRWFGAPASDGSGIAAADSIVLGGVTIRDVAVSVSPRGAGSVAAVGIGFLVRYSPTFDAARGTLTLRGSGRIAEQRRATALPLRFSEQQVRVLIGTSWAPLAAPELAGYRSGGRMTFDLRRGVLLVER